MLLVELIRRETPWLEESITSGLGVGSLPKELASWTYALLIQQS